MIRFGRGQHAGGFIQNENICLTIQRLEDLYALLHAHADVLYQRIGIDLEPVIIRQFQQRLARLGERRFQQPSVFGPQNDIFQNRKIFNQFKVLEHHPDACGNRGLAVRDIGLFAGDKNVAFVRFVESVKDRHQRRFARTVFTDNPVDCTGHDAD